VRFDNAHAIAQGRRGRGRIVHDHWHRTETDEGRPYPFTNADTLIRDFFREVRRVLADRGLSDAVTRVEERRAP